MFHQMVPHTPRGGKMICINSVISGQNMGTLVFKVGGTVLIQDQGEKITQSHLMKTGSSQCAISAEIAE